MTAADLKQWRQAHGWNQTQAARYLGTVQEHISRWENNKLPMPQSIVHLLHLLRQERNVREIENLLYKPLDR